MNAQPTEANPAQFVYSTAEIERELSRPGPRPAAKNNESLLRDAA